MLQTHSNNINSIKGNLNLPWWWGYVVDACILISLQKTVLSMHYCFVFDTLRRPVLSMHSDTLRWLLLLMHFGDLCFRCIAETCAFDALRRPVLSMHSDTLRWLVLSVLYGDLSFQYIVETCGFATFWKPAVAQHKLFGNMCILHTKPELAMHRVLRNVLYQESKCS
jgi:hypothetical protein